MTSLWSSGFVPTCDGPIALCEPAREKVGISTVIEQGGGRIPVHKYVYVPVGLRGIPGLSTVVVKSPAEVSQRDVELLNEALEPLEFDWSFARNPDGSGQASIERKALILHQGHGPNELLTYPTHSPSLVLAGLRLLAMESVVRYVASQQ